ncbi:glycine cleavage system aminomethyltransferase GcvT [Actinoallomurus bryophytorum]|uniref:Aminomethyltransferase n=1 Tax=Actinoallomurus bryophytorum TaxID=1490222 RepID=A0A543CNS3_9ACTN|nr:glycine cleavage system aminomethyltransferase GcvT [Actinoallomurus bryophytorum]TQL98758.1 aminomethyltransferase [Actinoallomurus bryophytorum]
MSAPDTKKTPLAEVHEDLGATVTEFAGYLMPLRYGSETAEHQAVRTSAGLFDLSHMGEIFVTGTQAGAALDHALIGHLSALAVGRARYTMICDPQGGVLDDLIVYRLAAETFLVVANASNAALVHSELVKRSDGFEGATVDDRSDAYALVAVQGPKAQAILSKLTDAPVADLKYYAGLPGAVAGIDALIARTGYTGEDGFELFVPASDAVTVWEALTEAGGDELRPCGLSARDTLRLEAGMPLYGNELTTATTPYDAGLGRTIKFDKGDFVGRAALAALADETPERTLIGLVAKGRRVPRHGYEIVGSDGTPCGVVTSGAPSPTLGKPIAMGYIDAGHTEDTDLYVDIRGKNEPVDKVALPFYRRTP